MRELPSDIKIKPTKPDVAVRPPLHLFTAFLLSEARACRQKGAAGANSGAKRN